MIMSYVLDCGCVFLRNLDNIFVMSRSCMQHGLVRPGSQLSSGPVAPQSVGDITQLCEQPFTCKCGQVITDGLPCGCGARPVDYLVRFSASEIRALRLAVLQQSVALSAHRIHAAPVIVPTYSKELATLDDVTMKLHRTRLE